ncbi:MAG: MFS transporter, partial [Clostridia bacterium]|nr:MFS transporter [Clostridia bacterium]
MEEIKQNREIFESKDYKRSRAVYVAQSTFEYFVSLLVTDAFLAKLLTNMGISDSVIGIVSSLISLAFLFQLLSIFVASKFKNTKKSIVLFKLLSNFLFFGLYLIPFTPLPVAVKTVLVFVCVLLAYMANYLITSILFKWANSYVDPYKRGEYSARREMVSLLTGIGFTLLIGCVVDKYEALGNIRGGFIFISAAILVLSVCEIVSLLCVKNEPKKTEKERHLPLGDILKNTLGNRNFLNIVMVMVLWNVARYTTIGFMGTFKTNDLLLSVGAVQLINMVASLGRFSISIPFGRYSDKHSFAKGMKLAFIIVAGSFAVNIFTNNSTWWLVVIHSLLYHLSFAGINQNSFNITYSYVKSEYYIYAMAIQNCIGGVAGFLASILGSRILSFVQAQGNVFLGIPMYGQQLLSAISLVILIVN